MTSTKLLVALLFPALLPASLAAGLRPYLTGPQLPRETSIGPEDGFVAAQQPDAVAPAPTAPPSVGAHDIELMKRQTSQDTCGYLSGDPKSPFACRAAARCVTNGADSVVWCCDRTIALSDCSPHTSCLDLSEYNSYTQSVSSVVSPGIGFCTSTGMARCLTYVYADVPVSAFTMYRCGSTYALAKVYASPTAPLQTGNSTGNASPTPQPDSPATTQKQSTSSTQSSAPEKTSDAPDSSGKGSGLSTEAIVGIATGVPSGVVAVLVLFAVIRHRRLPHS